MLLSSYRNDRLNNLVSLSPSLCTKQSILLGRGNSTTLCLKGRQANSGVRTIGTNNDQLLHRIQSVRTFTNLQYSKQSKFITFLYH